MHQEVEVKAKIKSIKELQRKLKNLGAKKSSQKREVDYYYTPKKGEKYYGKKSGLKFRIRHDGKSKKCNFEVHNIISSNMANEYEVGVDDFKTMQKALDLLPFKMFAKIDKLRISYKYKRINIVLDQVRYLGNFIEVEVMNLPEQKSLQMIDDFYKKLGFNKKDYIKKDTYAELMLKKSK